MSSRRTFLTAISALGPLHFLLPKQSRAAESYNKSPFEDRDYYEELWGQRLHQLRFCLFISWRCADAAPSYRGDELCHAKQG